VSTEPRRRALLVATEQYDDEGLQELRAPCGDVEELAEVLAHPDIGAFDVEEVLNQPKAVLEEAIEDFFDDARTDDLLLLYLSCHGVLSPNRELYFAAVNTKLKRLRATGIADTFVNGVMQHSRSQRIVLMLDCCHSGAFGRNLVGKGGPQGDLATRFDGRGRVTLTASTALEYAFEEGHNDPLTPGGSVFTRVLVEGLRTGAADRNNDGHVSLDELYEYVFDGVRERTPHQNPELTGSVRGDIYIARSPNALVALPQDIQAALDSPTPKIRVGATEHLGVLAAGRDAALARAARAALEALVEDDSRSVSAAASAALGATPPAPAAPPPPIVEPAAPRAEPVAAPAAEGLHDGVTRGREKLAAHRPDAAVTHFERALSSDPNSLPALTGRGWAHLHRHDLSGAAADFDAVLAHAPDDVDALLGRARVLVLRSRWDRARADLDRAEAIDGSSGRVLVARAELLSATSRYQHFREAIVACDKALALDPGDATALQLRGAALSALDDEDAAIADCTRALEIDERNAEALVTRAGAHASLEAYDDAIADIDRALEIDPASPDARIVMAGVRLAQERLEEAAAELEIALAANPDRGMGVILSALIHSLRDEPSEALAVCERARTLLPESGYPYWAVAGAHLALGEAEALLADLDTAVAVDPDFMTLIAGSRAADTVPTWRGLAYNSLGRHDDAVQEFDRALALAPRSVAALTGRAIALMALERWDSALGDVSRGLEIDPSSETLEATRRQIIARIADEAPQRLPAAIHREIEETKKRNRELVEKAKFENGFYTAQKKQLLELLNGTEQLIWLCRCARGDEVFRSVALLVTSERLIWCRESMWSSPEWGWIGWGGVKALSNEGLGFSITGNNDVSCVFKQITGGIDLSGEGIDLSGEELPRAIFKLANWPDE
jgi:tetratricopeptide (TPR) repeat protein